MAVNYGGEICQSLAGKPVDDLVGTLTVPWTSKRSRPRSIANARSVWNEPAGETL